jgi:hypothetical protein
MQAIHAQSVAICSPLGHSATCEVQQGKVPHVTVQICADNEDSFGETSKEIEKIQTSSRESKKTLSTMEEYRSMANISLRADRMAMREGIKRALEEKATKTRRASRWKFSLFFVRRKVSLCGDRIAMLKGVKRALEEKAAKNKASRWKSPPLLLLSQ